MAKLSGVFTKCVLHDRAVRVSCLRDVRRGKGFNKRLRLCVIRKCAARAFRG